MKRADFEALKHDGPIPGSAWTVERGIRPSDRPSEYDSVEEFLDYLFDKITEPEAAQNFIALMQAGAPLDLVIELLVSTFFGEGKINANMIAIVVPPLTVMLMRMAEAAGVTPRLSTDKIKIPPPEISLALKGKKLNFGQTDKAVSAGKKSMDLRDMPKKGGLMIKPERIV